MARISALVVFLALALAETPRTAHAEAFSPELVTGVRLGFSANQLLGGESAGPDFRARLGPTGGVFLGARFNRLEINGEALVSSRGAEFENGRVSGSVALYYLEFPVTGGFVFPFGDGSLEARAYGGFSLAYRLAGSLRDTANTDRDLMAATRDVDFGVLGGLGLSWGKSANAFLFDLRFYLGLRDVAENAVMAGGGGKNGSVGFLVGYRL